MTYKIPAVSVLSNQFPEFIKEDYPRFIRFVELYYEFLKNSEVDGIGESFDSIRDVDVTLDKFVNSLWKEFGINVPKTNIANDKYFLKHIKDFCSTKGSEESFRILFRHLFNTEIDIKYPKDYIFRSSDGEWEQDISFLVKVSKGDIYDIVGQRVNIHTTLQTVQIDVIKIKKIGEFYEVFMERTNYDAIQYGDILSFNGDVVATIEKSISKIEIIKPGVGFYVGQIFNINTISGLGAKIKVTKVGDSKTILNMINFIGNGTTTVTGTISSTSGYASGDIIVISGAIGTEQSKLNGTWTIDSILTGITFTFVVSTAITAGTLTTSLGKTNKLTFGNLLKIDIISFGYGYEYEFYASITSTSSSSIENEFPSSITLRPSGVVTVLNPQGLAGIDYTGRLHDQTLGFIDNGFISTDTYFQDNIVNPSYSGVIIQEFYTDSTVSDKTIWDNNLIAILDIKIGAIRKYPGYYKSDRGFISNSYKLQDSYYYQIYSYVISCVQSINTYKDIVKTLVHPTGLKLFGEQKLTNEITLLATLEILDRFIQVSGQSEFFIADSIPFYYLGKKLNDNFSVIETKTFALNKSITDLMSVIETQTFALNKSITGDSVSVSTIPEVQTLDITKYLTDSTSIEQYLYWVTDYGDVTYNNTETPAAITYVDSTYNIVLNN